MLLRLSKFGREKRKQNKRKEIKDTLWIRGTTYRIQLDCRM